MKEFLSKRQEKKNSKLIIIIMISVLLFFIFIGLVGVLLLQQTKRVEKEKIASSLQSVLSITREAVYYWYDSRVRVLTDIASQKRIIEISKNLLQLPRDQEILLKSPAMKELRDLLTQTIKREGYLGFFIIAPDYISIASLRDRNVGTINLMALQRKDLLDRVFDGETLLIPTIVSDVTLYRKDEGKPVLSPTKFIATPILSEMGQVMAVFTFRIDLFKDFNRIVNLGRIGLSGETYAFDKRGYFISDIRFNRDLIQKGILAEGEKAIARLRVCDPGGNLLKDFEIKGLLEERPLTLMAQKATAGESGINIQGYRDYRGVTVFGAWIWDEFLNIGLVTEIDEDEALEHYFKLNTLIIFSFIIILIISLILVLAIISFEKKTDREILRNEVRMKGILESASDGIIIIDKFGVISWANSSALEMFGYQEKEVMGQNFSMLFTESPDFSPDHYISEYMKTKGSALPCELQARRKDGSVFELYFVINKVMTETEVFFSVILRDITDEKHLHQELVDSMIAAEAADRVKSQFIANISHEIRTPLNVILGMSHMILTESLTGAQKEDLENIRSSANDLLDMFNSILNFSKLENKNLRIEISDFSLRHILDRLKGKFDEKSKRKNLVFKIEKQNQVPDILLGDKNLLFQVLEKLVDNGIKFTEKGDVTLSVELEEKKNNTFILNFSIKDTGIGIKKENLDVLFQPFKQLDSSISRKYKGLGINLILCQKLVELMGGEISVNSEEGQGSVFYFKLELKGKEKEAEKFLDNNQYLRYDSKLSLEGKKSINPSELFGKLEELRSKITMYDAEAKEKFESLKFYLSDFDIRLELKQMERNLGEYNFEDSLNILTIISEKVKQKLGGEDGKGF